VLRRQFSIWPDLIYFLRTMSGRFICIVSANFTVHVDDPLSCPQIRRPYVWIPVLIFVRGSYGTFDYFEAEFFVVQKIGFLRLCVDVLKDFEL